MSDGQQIRSFQDLASANVFEMSDEELKDFIVDCNATRRGYLNSVAPNVSQMNQQIELAQHELTARQSQKLARLSLIISTIAIAASAIGVIL